LTYVRLNIPQLARLGLFSRSTQGCRSEVFSLHRIRFAFGQGCDCFGYVDSMLKQFDFQSSFLAQLAMAIWPCLGLHRGSGQPLSLKLIRFRIHPLSARHLP
jgi:hypothetical protein